MIVILEKIFAVLVIMLIGFYVKRKNIVRDKGIPDLVNLVFAVTSPCMIFAAIATKEVSKDTVKYSFVVFGAAILYYVAATLAGYFLSKKLVDAGGDAGYGDGDIAKNIEKSGAKDNARDAEKDCGTDGSRRGDMKKRGGDRSNIGVYTFMFATLNNGFMGFPVTLAIFGKDALYYMVMHNIILTVYLYTFGGFVIGLGSEDKKSVSLLTALKRLKNPNTIATGLGFACMLLKLNLPNVIMEPVDTIGSATVPVSMIIVGMNLASSSFGEILRKKSLVVLALLKMTAIPAMGIGAAVLIPAPAEVKLCIALAISFPAAVASVPLVEVEGKDAGLASEGVALTTVMSLVTLPAVAMILSWLFL